MLCTIFGNWMIAFGNKWMLRAVMLEQLTLDIPDISSKQKWFLNALCWMIACSITALNLTMYNLQLHEFREITQLLSISKSQASDAFYFYFWDTFSIDHYSLYMSNSLALVVNWISFDVAFQKCIVHFAVNSFKCRCDLRCPKSMLFSYLCNTKHSVQS